MYPYLSIIWTESNLVDFGQYSKTQIGLIKGGWEYTALQVYDCKMFKSNMKPNQNYNFYVQ